MTNKYIDHIIASEANRLRNQHDPFVRNGGSSPNCVGIFSVLINTCTILG